MQVERKFYVGKKGWFFTQLGKVALGLAVTGGGAASAISYVLVQLLAGFVAATAFGITHQADQRTGYCIGRIWR